MTPAQRILVPDAGDVEQTTVAPSEGKRCADETNCDSDSVPALANCLFNCVKLRPWALSNTVLEAKEVRGVGGSVSKNAFETQVSRGRKHVEKEHGGACRHPRPLWLTMRMKQVRPGSEPAGRLFAFTRIEEFDQALS